MKILKLRKLKWMIIDCLIRPLVAESPPLEDVMTNKQVLEVSETVEENLGISGNHQQERYCLMTSERDCNV